MNKLILFLIAVLLFLQYSLWLGKNGLFDYIRINDNITKQKTLNTALKLQNSDLLSKINDLNDNQDLIEEVARSKFNMTKCNETFYRLVPSKSDSNHLYDVELSKR